MSERTLAERVKRIEARNRRVETDKTWELSKTRAALIMIFTYVAVGAYLLAIGVPNALQNAVVPTIAFTLSLLTLPFFKRIWVERVYNAG